MKSKPRTSSCLFVLALLGSAASACSSSDSGDDEGTLSIILESEDVIVDGLVAGDDADNIRDGWNVSFDKYIVALGHVEVHAATDENDSKHDDQVHVVDLTKLGPGGLALWDIEGLATGQYEFGYSVEADDAVQHSSVSDEDMATITAGDYSYLITGTLQKADGRSCPPSSLADPKGPVDTDGENTAGDPCYPAVTIDFEFAAAVEVEYGPCEVDSISGVAVTSGQESAAAVTIHGDHLFFNGFPEGSEGGIQRLAQWFADCDLNLDGSVSAEELELISPSDLAEFDDRFQLGGSPLTPVDDMSTYLKAQLMTQGHFQGEGECALNGEAHDH